MRDLVDLTCREVVELVTEYLSHAMSPDDRVRFEQHLLVCPPCTAHLGQVRSTVAIAGSLDADVPPAADPALLAVFDTWKKQ
jgi:anti-sigma factor RsiW